MIYIKTIGVWLLAAVLLGGVAAAVWGPASPWWVTLVGAGASVAIAVWYYLDEKKPSVPKDERPTLL